MRVDVIDRQFAEQLSAEKPPVSNKLVTFAWSGELDRIWHFV